MQWEVSPDLGLREGGWSPGGPSQSHSSPSGTLGVLLGAGQRGEKHVYLSIQLAAAVCPLSLSLVAAALGPRYQVFQAGQLMNLLLLNDRKKKNLIGSQQWEGCFWLRAPRSLGH